MMGTITLLLEDETIDPVLLTEIVQPAMEKAEVPSVAVWREYESQTVVADLNQKSEETDVIVVYGSSHCLLPYGKNLQPEQKDGCIISEGLAEKLFSTRRAEGQTVQYAGHTWTICDVIPQPKQLLLVEGTDLLEDVTFNRLSAMRDGGVPRQLAAERLIRQYGISAKLLRLDVYTDLSWISEMIPSQWSDFKGWRQNWKQKKQELQLTAGCEKSEVELLYLRDVKRCYAFAALSLLCLIPMVRLVRTGIRERKREE